MSTSGLFEDPSVSPLEKRPGMLSRFFSGPGLYLSIAFGVILIDQLIKIWVHTNMYLHEEIVIFDFFSEDPDLLKRGQWGFKLHYLRNPGMAFGIRWETEFGKLFLTLFRILAVIGITFYLFRSFKKGLHRGFLFSLALILGGAAGNVIDSVFYAVWLDQPHDSTTPWFHGQVIDMLYFPLFEFTWPQWVPYLGGDDFFFFRPVFNIADSSIFIGVATILIFQNRFFKDSKTTQIEEKPEWPESNNIESKSEIGETTTSSDQKDTQ